MIFFTIEQDAGTPTAEDNYNSDIPFEKPNAIYSKKRIAIAKKNIKRTIL